MIATFLILRRELLQQTTSTPVFSFGRTLNIKYLSWYVCGNVKRVMGMNFFLKKKLTESLIVISQLSREMNGPFPFLRQSSICDKPDRSLLRTRQKIF